MKNFEYAQPTSEAEVLDLLAAASGSTELLAGGTDLIGLMKQMVVNPDRVIDVTRVAAWQSIEFDSLGQLWVGGGVHLDDFLSSPLTDPYPAVKQVIQGIASPQLQSQGTLAGELLRRPRCWYFRNGQGLLADHGRRVVEGDNRFHAILGNRGPAKFVSALRLAPALISLRAQVRVVGPAAEDEQFWPLERLYQAPGQVAQRENTLARGQVVTHVILPPDQGFLSAAYEVRHGVGPDMPLAAAAATLQVVTGVVRKACVVLGQVAPIPWISGEAERVLLGNVVTEGLAKEAGLAAVVDARPLSHNGYKVQLAQVAVKRAILRALGSETGGF